MLLEGLKLSDFYPGLSPATPSGRSAFPEASIPASLKETQLKRGVGMAAPVPQKLIVEVVSPGRKPASGQAAKQAVRALAQIIGRQIAREQFRNQQETSPEPRDREARRAQRAPDLKEP